MTKSHLRRLLLLVVALLVVLSGWAGWQAYALLKGVSRITVPVPRPTYEATVTIPPLDSTQRINVLVLGSDNDRKKEEARPLSQSMMIVTIDPEHHHVGMLSIPRDFYVPIRGHGWGKIDLAYKYGGVALARYTVEKLFGIPIHYYAWVGLNGFIKVIDTFGGVTLDVQYPILDDRYPNDMNSANPYGYRRVFIPPGWQHMDGTDALEYVRSRHGDLLGDFGRSERQQQVLVDLQQKMDAMDVLQHLPQLVDDLQNSVRTDFSLTQLYQLDQLSHQIHQQDVTQVVLSPPTYSQYGWTPDHQQSIVVPNWTAIRREVSAMFAPIARPAPARPLVPTATPRPASVRPTVRPTAGSTQTVRPTATPTPAPSTSVPATGRAPNPLVFVRNGQLFEVSGTDVVQLTHLSGVSAAMPAISPDGKRLAYIRFGADVSDLWIMDLSTGRQQQLTYDTDPLRESKPDIPNNLWAAWPAWSPDGKSIIYSSDRAKLRYPPSDARAVDLALWSIPASGGPSVQVTTPSQTFAGNQPIAGAGGDQDAVWRPGTREVVYVAWSVNAVTSAPYSQLAVHDMGTGATYRLTPTGGRVMQPAVSPDGREVAFVRRALDGTDQLVIAPLVGTGAQMHLGARTVEAAGTVGQPAFSRDGRWMSFVNGNGAGFGLDLVSRRTGDVRELRPAGRALDARWRPIWLP